MFYTSKQVQWKSGGARWKIIPAVLTNEPIVCTAKNIDARSSLVRRHIICSNACSLRQLSLTARKPDSTDWASSPLGLPHLTSPMSTRHCLSPSCLLSLVQKQILPSMSQVFPFFFPTDPHPLFSTSFFPPHLFRESSGSMPASFPLIDRDGNSTASSTCLSQWSMPLESGCRTFAVHLSPQKTQRL